MGDSGQKKIGTKYEDRIRAMFKGEKYCGDEADVETKNCLFEVKSCRLFTNGINGNHKRDFKKAQHKRIEQKNKGRFVIKLENHDKLIEAAKRIGKAAKYVFIVRYNGQMIFKTMKAEKLEFPKRTKDKENYYMPISKVFE